MTNSNSHVNGASLEDCHTNFFALTDLCGIKWRSYRIEHVVTSEPLEDPIIFSCSKCLAHDVLSVWRRVQHVHRPPSPEGLEGMQPPPPAAVTTYKELWIFWYGDEPELHNLLAPQLHCKRLEDGNWENGLSYECRSLLFKALHKFIERCLLSRGFVKLGRWFTQPYTCSDKQHGKNYSTNLSFAFSFFVHGESTVCASLELRQHAPVRRITRAHLSAAAHGPTPGLPVLLAPYGLSGLLTGHSVRLDAPAARHLADTWRHLYPLDARLLAGLQTGRESHMPSVVEVLVGDVRMKYLSSYVLVCDSDGPAPVKPLGVSTSHPSGPAATGAPVSPSSAAAAAAAADPSAPLLASTHPLLEMSAAETRRLSELVPARAWQQATVGTPLARAGLALRLTASVGDAAPETLGQWDFRDPGQRSGCSCVNCKRKLRHKQQWAKRQEKERPPRMKVGAWHRRTGCTRGSAAAGGGVVGVGQAAVTLAMDAELASGLARLNGRPPPPPPPPAYYKSQPCSSAVGIDSPASMGPSPLPTPHSQQPTTDTAMPTLSPHPPTPGGSADLVAKSMGTAPRTPSSAAVGAASGRATPAGAASTSIPVYSPYLKPPNSAPCTPHSVGPPPSDPPPPADVKPSLIPPGGHQLQHPQGPLLLPPQLPIPQQHADADMVDSSNLYNFGDLNLWLSCPVKKPSDFRPSLLRRVKEEVDTTEHHGADSDAMLGNPLMLEGGVVLGGGRGVKRPADPYEFDDDPAASAAAAVAAGGTPGPAIDGVVIKTECDDPSARGKSSESLFTSAGLEPKLADLEHLFDDRESEPDEPAVSTPPGSNRPPGGTADDAGPMMVGGTGAGSSGAGPGGMRIGARTCLQSAPNVLSSVELSKIYPTPPSHEHNHNPSASPVCPPDHQLAMDAAGGCDVSALTVFKSDPGGSGSSMDATDGDDSSSCVYRPALLCAFVSASKYAPLDSLPSQFLQPLNLPMDAVYKPSWQCAGAAGGGAAGPAASVRPQQQQQVSVATPQQSHPSAKPGTMGTPPGPIQSMNQMALTGMMTQPPLGSGPRAVGLSPISPAIYDNPGSLKSVGPGSVGPRSVGGPYEPPSPASPYVARVPPAQAAAAAGYPGSVVHASADTTAAAAVTAQLPEVSALLVNVLLEDSVLNMFHDHNFDSCTMCVCNAGANRVGNIRGREASLYIPASQKQRLPLLASSLAAGGPADDPVSCKCGYSAVVNRRLAYRSGLFIEDEVELTGERLEVRYEQTRPPLGALLRPGDAPADVDPMLDAVGPDLLQLIQDRSLSWPAAASALNRVAPGPSGTPAAVGGGGHPQLSYLEFTDAAEVVRSAVDLLRGASSAPPPSTPAAAAAAAELRQRWPVHRWPFSRVDEPHCSQDLVRVMRVLQPHLQDAIQKKRQTKLWEPTYQVTGPLTWRQFHRLAGRGTDDHCTPQPVPALLVGHDGEWVSTSPFSLRHWEGLLLEPVSAPRDVAYLVVAPAGDNEFIVSRVRQFFRELSTAYESCNLGRHVPIGSSCPEGVLRINRNAAVKLANLSVDDWFSHLGDAQVAAKLKLYAQYCLHYVGPYLQTSMETSAKSERPAASPMPPPATPDPPSTPKQSEEEVNAANRAAQEPHGSGTTYTSGGAGGYCSPPQLPQMVVYFVDPFSYGAEVSEMGRLINLALMRAYLHMRSTLPDNMQKNITLQVVSLESIISICQDVDRSQQRERLRALAFSVFSQCRRQYSGHHTAKTLTGFGPSAGADQHFKGKPVPSVDLSARVRSAMYVLAPQPDAQRETEVLNTPADLTRTLFCAYCLSEDQNWLLASCTDARGELRRTTAINVRIPNRLRRRKVSARRLGLQKLMDWLLGIMVQSTHPWRLVVGRLGRIGHGELKSWSSVLSRKSLTRFSNQLKELCGRCAPMTAADAPAVVSACLVSLEPDPSHRVLADQCSPDEASSATSLKLSTPHDISCTHIMVFPTSATTQCAQTAFQQEHINALGGEFIEEDFLQVIDAADEDGVLGENLFDDFNWEETFGGEGVVGGSPLDGERPGASPGGGGLAGGCGGKPGGLYAGAGLGAGGLGAGDDEPTDEFGTVLQQPLALGYMPSTADIGSMPGWFWAGAAAAARAAGAGEARPVFLRSALHLHSPTHNQEDVLQQQSQARGHPLDSGTTTDVLRYVLENYNRLSWLVMDPSTQDRRSCLPIHMQLLVQLYTGMAAVV